MEQTQARNDSYQKASSRFGYRRLLMNDIHCDMSRSRQNINQCISYIWEDLLLALLTGQIQKDDDRNM
jgi:hypothetical protein